MAEDGRKRLGETHDLGGEGEQGEAEDQRQRQAEDARQRAPALFDAVRQDRDEDEVVDPEHDLHRDQGRERGPGGGVGDEPLQGIHDGALLARPCPPQSVG